MRRTITLLAILLCGASAGPGWTSDGRDEKLEPPAEECAPLEVGRVLVEFDLDPDGKVQNPRVVEYRQTDMFNHAALKAVLDWEYEGTGEWQFDKRIWLPFRKADDSCK